MMELGQCLREAGCDESSVVDAHAAQDPRGPVQEARQVRRAP